MSGIGISSTAPATAPNTDPINLTWATPPALDGTDNARHVANILGEIGDYQDLNKVKIYINQTAPRRAYIERHLRYMLERKTLGSPLPDLVVGNRSTDQSSKLSMDQVDEIIRDLRATISVSPVYFTNDKYEVLRRAQQKLLASNVIQSETKASSRSLDVLHTALTSHIEKLKTKTKDLGLKSDNIVNMLNRIKNIAFDTNQTSLDKIQDGFPTGYVAAVEEKLLKLKAEAETAKTTLQLWQDVLSGVNDAMQIPLVIKTGNTGRPFSSTSIKRTPAFLKGELDAWEATYNADKTALSDANRQVRGAFQKLYAVLTPGTVQPNLWYSSSNSESKIKSSDIRSAQTTLIGAASARRVAIQDLRDTLETAVLIISDTLSAMGSSTKLRREDSPNAQEIVQTALKQGDQTLQQLMERLLGASNGVSTIVQNYQFTDPQIASLQTRIRNVATALDATTQPVTSLPTTANLNRSLQTPFDVQKIYAWLATQRTADSSVAQLQGALSLVRSELGAKEQQRREGRLRVQQLERTLVDIMRKGIELLGTGDAFDANNTADSKNQFLNIAKTRNNDTKYLVERINGTLDGVNLLIRTYKFTKDDITGLSVHGTAYQSLNFLTDPGEGGAIKMAEARQTKLSLVRTRIAAKETARRLGEKRLDDLQRDASAIMRKGIELLGTNATFNANDTTNSSEQFTLYADAPDSDTEELLKRINGTLAGVNLLKTTYGVTSGDFDVLSLPGNAKDTLNFLTDTSETGAIKIAEAQQTKLSVVRTSIAAKETARRLGEKRLDDLQRDAAAMVVRHVAALGGNLAGSASVSTFETAIDGAKTTWVAKQTDQVKKVTGALAALKVVAANLGFASDASTVTTITDGASETSSHTIDTALDAMIAALPGMAVRLTDDQTMYDATYTSLETLLNEISSRIVGKINTFSRGNDKLKEAAKTLDAITNDLLRQAQSAFPGRTAVESIGTLAQRLAYIVDTQITDAYAESTNKIKQAVEELQEVARRAEIPFNIDGVESLTTYTVQQLADNNTIIPQIIVGSRNLAQSLEQRFITRSERVSTLKRQAKELNSVLAKITAANEKRFSTPKEAAQMSEMYKKSALVFINVVIAAKANANNFALLDNAVELACNVYTNRIWNYALASNGDAIWMESQGVPFIDDFKRIPELYFVSNLIESGITTPAGAETLATTILAYYNTFKLYINNNNIKNITELLRNWFTSTTITSNIYSGDKNKDFEVAAALRTLVGIMMITPAYVPDTSMYGYVYDNIAESTLIVLVAQNLVRVITNRPSTTSARIGALTGRLNEIRQSADLAYDITMDNIHSYVDEITAEFDRPLLPDIPIDSAPALSSSSTSLAVAAASSPKGTTRMLDGAKFPASVRPKLDRDQTSKPMDTDFTSISYTGSGAEYGDSF